MKRIKIALFIVSAVIVVVAIIISVQLITEYNLEVNRNERATDAAVARNYEFAMHEEDFRFFHLTFATWDVAYMFRPGTTRSEIEAIIGVVDENIPEVIIDGYTQMLFMFDGFRSPEYARVLANIHGEKPYQFYVEGFKDKKYVRISWWATCRVEIGEDGVITIIIEDNPDTHPEIPLQNVFSTESS